MFSFFEFINELPRFSDIVIVIDIGKCEVLHTVANLHNVALSDRDWETSMNKDELLDWLVEHSMTLGYPYQEIRVIPSQLVADKIIELMKQLEDDGK